MYRFRTIDHLLDKYHELENQEIYFATPEELNDPMEGYRDLFWKGDTIVWKNFIINYIKSTEHLFALTILLNDEKKIDDNDIIVLSHSRSYRTAAHRDLIKQIIDKAFENKFIKGLPESLAKRQNPIRREELLSYIQIIHPFIINSISEVYHKGQMTDRPFFHQNLDGFSQLLGKHGNLADLVNKMELENSARGNLTEKFFSLISLVTQQTRLLTKYNYSDKALYSNDFFLISELPDKYLSKLESSIYPDWYSASFLYECSNSSLWGHYGDNHKGACLKFRTSKNNEAIEMNLETEYGYSSGPIIGMRPHTFRKITYQNKHVEIDFFRAIARLNKMELNTMWYSDSEGNLSVCGEHLNSNEEEWRNKYWENFYTSISAKLTEWDYEQEYRLVVHGDFIDYREKEKRKLKYDFNDLEAIIFGIKTTTADKIRIIKIIEDKCDKTNRKEFDFYQAYYSKDDGKILTYKLNLIKFGEKNSR